MPPWKRDKAAPAPPIPKRLRKLNSTSILPGALAANAHHETKRIFSALHELQSSSLVTREKATALTAEIYENCLLLLDIKMALWEEYKVHARWGHAQANGRTTISHLRSLSRDDLDLIEEASEDASEITAERIAEAGKRQFAIDERIIDSISDLTEMRVALEASLKMERDQRAEQERKNRDDVLETALARAEAAESLDDRRADLRSETEALTAGLKAAGYELSPIEAEAPALEAAPAVEAAPASELEL